MRLFKRVVKSASIVASATFLLFIAFHYANRKTVEDTNINIENKSTTNRKTVSPLLILFTTVKERDMIPHHQFAFNAVLTNRLSFKPRIQPVIFLNFTNSTLARRATDAGWDVLPLTRTNKDGTPFLKDMYRTIFDTYNAMLYGYANGDLLFNDGLLKTLEAVEKKMTALNNNVLLIGRRTNVDVDLKSATVSVDDFQRDRLHDLRKKRGFFASTYAIDYFFFSKEGCSLNWTTLVDVVIGRPGYDNYLVAMAIREKVNVIEATETLLAIHVSEINVKSHGAKNNDSLYNIMRIGGFIYDEGLTTSPKLALKTDIFGEIFMIRKPIK